MKSVTLRHLLPSLCLLAALLLSGCAAPRKSVIVLLPEDGKPSGEVTVVNDSGSQLLNRSWQSVEIGKKGSPATPVVLEKTAVQGFFGTVLSAMPAPPVHYLLYFKLASSELLPESRLLLPEIVSAIEKRQPAQLSVVGHTDTAGTEKYNHRLGLQRATAVAELLTSMGAVPATVVTSSRGKKELLVKTPDHTLEPHNRRAEVTVR